MAITYFPSKFVPDEQVVTNLITNTKQGLFLFDSNSISHEVYHYIIDSSDLIKQNGHKIIIAINSSDNNILSKMLSKPFSLRYQFSSIELRQNQNKADELGLSRRKTKQTNVETVVLLSKGEIDSKKVRVEFSLEDMDMSGFQKGATYEQIKAYVLEHTGLKVSSLYISQIKRKCGLDVGQNYNLSKKEDAKVPKCPPEKEAAIRDALKYFQMI